MTLGDLLAEIPALTNPPVKRPSILDYDYHRDGQTVGLFSRDVRTLGFDLSPVAAFVSAVVPQDGIHSQEVVRCRRLLYLMLLITSCRGHTVIVTLTGTLFDFCMNSSPIASGKPFLATYITLDKLGAEIKRSRNVLMDLSDACVVGFGKVPPLMRYLRRAGFPKRGVLFFGSETDGLLSPPDELPANSIIRQTNLDLGDGLLQCAYWNDE